MKVNELQIELIPDHELGGYTARLPDIPACGEGETKEEAIADLREALIGYIELYGLEDAASRVIPLSVENAGWSLSELASA